MPKKRKRSQVGRSAVRRSRRGRIRPDDAAQDEEPLAEKILRGRENVDRAPDVASSTELESETVEGRVVSIRGADAYVEPVDGGEVVVCRLRKSTRVPHPETNALAVGDFVVFLGGGDPPLALTEIRPRRTRLVRVRRGRDPHVICANVDVGVIVGSAADPPFKPRLVDRYLIAMREGGLEPVLVVNKLDLTSAHQAAEMLAPYATIGIPALAVSAETGVGMDDLVPLLRDRTSVFSGQSGVGKTSLLNRLLPGLDLDTKSIQQRTGKGRHTTSASTLYRFPFGGSVVDTPGVRTFLLHKPSREALEDFFPEIVRAARDCRFGDCRHAGDAGCAIRAAIAAGEVTEARLESFRILDEEIRAA